ncbi:MAG: two-component regulator propeller domain-containing protein [Saprospiraceae bacterium]
MHRALGYYIYFLIIFNVFFLDNLLSQEQPLTIPTKYYSLNEGLSERLVTDIAQSSDGHLWIATNNGLNKFDGYEFVIFNNSPDNPNRLSEFSIEKLQLTKDDKIAIIYRNNLFFFDLLDAKTHKITKINMLPENGIMGIVRQVTVDNQGNILVLTVGKDDTYLFRYLGQGQFQLVFQIKESRTKRSAEAQILHLKNGNYLLNDSEKGLRLLNKKGSILHTHDTSDFSVNVPPQLFPSPINFLHQDKQGKVWIAFQEIPGVFNWSESNFQIDLHAGIPNRLNYSYLWEDKTGNLLFAETNGHSPFPTTQSLYCLKKNGNIINFSYLVNLGPRIQSIHSDDFFKTMIFGIDTGLKIVQNNYSRIKTLLSRSLTSDQRGAVIRGISGNAATVYFAEEDGHWFALNLEKDSLYELSLFDQSTGTPIALSCTQDLHLDSQNNLWGIACNNIGEGLFLKADPMTGATQIYRYAHVFRAFTAASDGTYWLLAEPTGGDKSKLVHFNPRTTRFDEYADNELNNPLKSAASSFVLESGDGMLWVGTRSGLVRIDPQRKFSRTYQMESETHGKGLKSNTIYIVHEDNKKQLWLGTNNGLSVLNPENNKIVTYDRKNNGLTNNTICGIVPDEKGNFWISTYNGLSYFDKKTKQFHNFYQTDGLSHDEFNRFSYYRDVNGRFYFGGVNGLNIFKGNDLLVNEATPPVVFTKLVRFNNKLDSLITCHNCLNTNEKLIISTDDIYFQVHFMLPHFANPAKNQFQVKLEGYESKWTYLGNTSFIRYTSLPPGDYTLLVKGADPNGNWNQEALRLRIHVEKTFLQTVWFYLLCIALAVAISYAAFRYQLEQKLQVERFRIKLSSDLHDELSGLLSGIAMQTDMLQMSSKDETINTRLKHIGEVSRKAMSKMSDVIWSIDSRKDKIENLIKRMYEHADDILLPINIHYTFNIRRIDPQHRIPPTTRQELYLIFKEAINNIAKHSNASSVAIDISNTDGVFQLEIKDNGRGELRQYNGHNFSSGQGLSNIKMRAQRINAKVEILKEDGYTIRLRMRRFA